MFTWDDSWPADGRPIQRVTARWRCLTPSNEVVALRLPIQSSMGWALDGSFGPLAGACPASNSALCLRKDFPKWNGNGKGGAGSALILLRPCKAYGNSENNDDPSGSDVGRTQHRGHLASTQDTGGRSVAYAQCGLAQPAAHSGDDAAPSQRERSRSVCLLFVLSPFLFLHSATSQRCARGPP